MDVLADALDTAPVTSLAPPQPALSQDGDGGPAAAGHIAATERLQMVMGEALAAVEQAGASQGWADRNSGPIREPGWRGAELASLLRAELEEAVAVLGIGSGMRWEPLERLIRPARELLLTLEQAAPRPEPSDRLRRTRAAERCGAPAVVEEANRLANSLFGQVTPVYRYEPILHLKQNVISTYRCIFTVKLDGLVHWSDGCVRYPLARAFHPAADLLILARAVSDLDAAITRNQRCAICVTVHADTLSSPSQQQRYLASLSKLPLELRRLLLVEIVAFEAGVWPGKILQAAQGLAPLVRACFVRLNLTYPSIRDLAFGPVKGVASCLPPARSVGHTPSQLPIFARKAVAARLVSCIGGVRTPAGLARIRDAGVVFAYGPAVAAPVTAPTGVITLAELFVPSADHDPRSLRAGSTG